MARVRDSQRSKLYAAERASGIQTLGKLGKMTIAECDAFARKVLRSAYIRRRYDRAERIADWLQVEHGRGGGRAYAGMTTIRLGVWGRQPAVVLHEVAHLLTPSRAAAHGWEFAAAMLDLVRAGMGVEAHDKLKAAYVEHKVRFRRPVKRAPLTPERREALVAQLADARAVKAAASPVPGEVCL